jgi:hypothetical protein
MAHVKLTPEVSGILSRSTFDGNSLKLPPAQLGRSLYDKVNKAIVAAGGKWKGGKTQAHIFPGDAREAFGDALSTGVVVDKKKDCPKLAALGAETVIRFPAGAFKESGTNIATRLIRIRG